MIKYVLVDTKLHGLQNEKISHFTPQQPPSSPNLSVGSRPPRRKERQAQFGGVAIASPCSRDGVKQVEGDHHRSPEQALCLPGATPTITTTWCHFRETSCTMHCFYLRPSTAQTTHRGPCAGRRELRNDAGTSLAERYGR